MRKFTVLLTALMLVALPLLAGEKEHERLAESGDVLQDVLRMPDNIPQDILDKADCVIVFPSVLKFAFGVGGSYGRGAMECRSGPDFRGPWGPPAMYRLEGGSFGFQLGGQATDLVLLVMNPHGVKSLMNSKVKLGADMAAAAGPVGRDAVAATDAYMRAEILSYSRSRGLFAGVSLEGSTLRPDNGANERLYGRKITAEQILMQHEVQVPEAAKRLVSLLQNASPRNHSS